MRYRFERDERSAFRLAALDLTSDGLTVQVDQGDDPLVIRAFGEVDIASARTLEESLRQVLGRDHSSIILDLAGVSFIDSTGLRVLLWAVAHSRENGDRLRIRCGSAAVCRVIEVTGLERSLPLTA
jgi:anti-sigma B factor antagonist